MRAICAWCRAAGRPADLGEREPLDDPRETHGLCQPHLAQLLAEVPSRSSPGIRFLMVVTSRDRSLYEYLSRVMAQVSGVRVIMDRRHGERRRENRAIPRERRPADRRRHRGLTQSMGCTFVRLGPASNATLNL